jgi:hypothetical protein
MRMKRIRAAIVASLAIVAAGAVLAPAQPALADAFSVSPSSIAFLDPGATGDDWARLRVTPDPGYLVSLGDSYRTGPSGTYQELRDEDCGRVGPGTPCNVMFYAFSRDVGEDASWSEVVAECLSPGVGCRYLTVPVTMGPQRPVFLAALPTSIDFGGVQVGTTITRDVPMTLDPGYSIHQLSSGGWPVIDNRFGTCDIGVLDSCSLRASFTPPHLGGFSGTLAATECTADWVCVENNAVPVFESGTGVAAQTTTVLTASANPVRFGSPVSYTAAVTTPSSIAPTGSVTFYDNGLSLGSQPLDASGTASITVPMTQPGSHSITARYGGDTLHLTSTSAALSERVAFDSCYSGSGALTVGAGQSACVTGTRVGAVTVAPGGALAVLGAHVSGAVNSSGAAAVTICGTTVSGAVNVVGTTGPVVLGQPGTGCAGNSIGGALTVGSNTGGTALEANTVGGALNCTSNTPLPSDGGHPNTVTGLRTGQCASADF